MTSLSSTSGSSAHIILFLLIAVVLVGVILALLIIRGNLYIMRFFVYLGFPLLSGNVSKDYRLLRSFNNDVVGWLKIPNTCYAPVMLSDGLFYKTHDYKKNTNSHGELHISNNLGSQDLRRIAYPSSGDIGDLTIIDGSASVRSTNIRESKLTLLNRYILSDLKHLYPDIHLLDKGRMRIFNLLFAVELKIENRQKFKFTDRESFISSLRESAFVDTGYEANNSIVILSGSTGLDTLLVFMVEKED